MLYWDHFFGLQLITSLFVPIHFFIRLTSKIGWKSWKQWVVPLIYKQSSFFSFATSDPRSQSLQREQTGFNFYSNPFKFLSSRNNHIFRTQIFIIWTLCNNTNGHISSLSHWWLYINFLCAFHKMLWVETTDPNRPIVVGLWYMEHNHSEEFLSQNHFPTFFSYLLFQP